MVTSWTILKSKLTLIILQFPYQLKIVRFNFAHHLKTISKQVNISKTDF